MLRRGLRSCWHQMLQYQDLAVGGEGPPTIREDFDTMFVVPIVNDTFEKVRIGPHPTSDSGDTPPRL
jgi:hypothetical protein